MRKRGTLTGLGLTPKSQLEGQKPLVAVCVARRDAMDKVLVLLIDNLDTVGVYEKDHGKGTHIPHAWSGRLIGWRKEWQSAQR